MYCSSLGNVNALTNVLTNESLLFEMNMERKDCVEISSETKPENSN